MTIKVWNYLNDYRNEKKEIERSVRRVFESGTLILGDHVKSFEEKFSAYCGVKYGVGVGSGTDALFLSLKAFDIGEGDEVITVANTAVPTVSAIVSAGAVPVFVDIHPETYLMDPGEIEKVISEKSKCIIPVHLYGQCADMEQINDIAQKHRLHVIEDCAQCHGAELFKRKAGSMSDAAAFSFYPTKILGGFGDGGMIVTDREEHASRLKKLRLYGMDGKYYSEEHGYNSRLDELHASILLDRLPKLNTYINKRRELAENYDRLLKNSGVALPQVMKGNKHVYYLYVVRHPKRDRIISELENRSIHLNISYPWPIHVMPAYKKLGYHVGDFPITEKAAVEIFSLPMFPSLTHEEQSIVSDNLHEVISGIST